LPFTAFTHVDHALSHGIYDSIGTRNSPALMNLAWSNSLMWDGAANHLDMQALAPIESPVEMGENFAHVIEKLKLDDKYVKLFNEAYGDDEITGERFLKALAAFELTLISANSKYDKVQRGDEVFTEQEQKGLLIFNTHCNNCHTAPLFTNNTFQNNGLPLDSTLMDYGRGVITGKPKDNRKFKVPTLRNIEFSFPYMHDGRFTSLYQVLNHYNSGIEFTETLHKDLKGGVKLSDDEKVDLVAFLLTLSDKEFCFNPEFGFPRK
jgi:cytochrome c peroxidase